MAVRDVEAATVNRVPAAGRRDTTLVVLVGVLVGMMWLSTTRVSLQGAMWVGPRAPYAADMALSSAAFACISASDGARPASFCVMTQAFTALSSRAPSSTERT